ncbi:hypothetical protein [Dongia sp.]|uniref:hypothetical protein n=1 Tax=Dongia sp. TaxID=1977262 RepID=UPI003752FD9D
MLKPTPPRFYNVARARIADTFIGLAICFTCFLFASLLLSMAYDVVTHDPDDLWLLLLFVGPIVLGLVYAALHGILFAIRRIGQLSRPADLDMPEIVISRRPKHRLGWTIHQWFFLLLIPPLFLKSVDFRHLTGGAIASIAFTLLVVLVLLGNIWRIWRIPPKALAPVILNSEGFEDKSTDGPPIPWHDIADIDKSSMTLTGETGQRFEAASPDRRLTKRWTKRSAPMFRIDSSGLQPDDPYACALIRAYWLRRIGGHATEAGARATPAVQRG